MWNRRKKTKWVFIWWNMHACMNMHDFHFWENPEILVICGHFIIMKTENKTTANFVTLNSHFIHNLEISTILWQKVKYTNQTTSSSQALLRNSSSTLRSFSIAWQKVMKSKTAGGMFSIVMSLKPSLNLGGKVCRISLASLTTCTHLEYHFLASRRAWRVIFYSCSY